MSMVAHPDLSTPSVETIRPGWTAADRRALLAFAVVAVAFPWTGWAVLIKSGWHHAWSMPLFVLSGGFCSVAGVVALCVRGGVGVGLTQIVRELTPRGGAWPWLMSLLWGPLWLLLAGVAYAWCTDKPVDPNWSELGRYASSGILFLWLTGPLGEELGWRGFLLPTLLRRWSFNRAAVVVGIFWALWHTPLMLQRWAGDPLHLPYFVAMVTLFSFMLGQVAIRGGLLPAMLLHWSINASQEVVPHVFGASTEPGKLMWLILTVTLLPLVYLGCKLKSAKTDASSMVQQAPVEASGSVGKDFR